MLFLSPILVRMPCGIGSEKWVVCPRRLFAFPPTSDGTLESHRTVSAHELEIIKQMGFDLSKPIGIFPEVYLKYTTEEQDGEINYHFDYILAELQIDQITVGNLWDMLEIKDAKDKSKYKKHLQNGGFIPNGQIDESSIIKYFPNLDSFAIAEVMTASTSGSNKAKGTDIKGSYLKMLRGLSYDCPGINKRQVWGRMATQLFAKSALAENWNSKTYWIVQDSLLKNICKTTKLSLTSSCQNKSSINFIELSYSGESADIAVSSCYQLDPGLSFDGTGTAVDILLAKNYPSKRELLSALMRSQLSSILFLD
jgi:hypothetical protein